MTERRFTPRVLLAVLLGLPGVAALPFLVTLPPGVPPLAAISNAMYRATHKRFYALPMSPPRVLEKLDQEIGDAIEALLF